jgi:hypothetical protein
MTKKTTIPHTAAAIEAHAMECDRIQWLAANSDTSIRDGEPVVVCDHNGREVARGELRYAEDGRMVNGFPIDQWLAVGDVECWTTGEAMIVYVYREVLEPCMAYALEEALLALKDFHRRIGLA